MRMREFLAVLSLVAVPVSVLAEYRTIDGSDNNRAYPEMGKAGEALYRQMSEHYGDHVSSMTGSGLPGAREISNVVSAQVRSMPNKHKASDFVWQWGQFLDHDLDLTPAASPAEEHSIPVPAGDPHFDPNATGTQVIHFVRSMYDTDTGTSSYNPRQQLNQITAWIDASNVYGSDPLRADHLRLLDGSGKLKTSSGDLLPFNTLGLPNAGGPGSHLFLAGDERVNEQVGLTAMHTLFVREHNRQADFIARRNRKLNGDAIYQRARRFVGALMQVITYREFLPVVLGGYALTPYKGYQPHIDAGVMNEFSTAAYRFGHSMLNEQLARLDDRGDSLAALPLRNAFFAPDELIERGIEPLLRGLASQRAQQVDPYVVESVRSFLFGPPGAGGLDLAALNIQRGRDHGLPSYNDARESMALRRALSFDQITQDGELRERLIAAYGHVDAVELWVGCMAENHRRGALVGELAALIIKKQFERLRDGDRFWYALHFKGSELRRLESTTLADIIRRNTSIGGELHDDVFRVYH